MYFYHLVRKKFIFGLVCFTSQSTAMVMLGQSVHLTTLFFLGKLEQVVNQYFVYILVLVTNNSEQSSLKKSAEGRRMTVDIIS